jgi:glycosyltransferase involved in cell wall biosynthesis
MKVVVAHDYLTQRGGGERVALELARSFPGAQVLTSMYLPDQTFPEFRDLEVVSLGLERAGFFRRDPRRALPVLGEMFRRQRVEADLLVCSTSGFSHLLRSTGAKVVYCHNPPRWLHQREDYVIGLGAPERLALLALRARLLRLDRQGAAEAAHYIANSENVAARVKRVYGRRADVIHPPRGLEPEGKIEPIPGLVPGFLLTVGRPRGYKRTNLLVDAVAGMPEETLVTVGHVSDDPPANVHQLSGVSDAQLRWLYRSARALLACSKEDFGLTPVEAFGFGLPVGATHEGGYVETCVAGVTGVWLDTSSLPALRQSIRRLVSTTWDRDRIARHGGRWSPSVFRDSIQRVAMEHRPSG